MKMNIFIRIWRKSVDHSPSLFIHLYLINEEEGRELEYE